MRARAGDAEGNSRLLRPGSAPVVAVGGRSREKAPVGSGFRSPYRATAHTVCTRGENLAQRTKHAAFRRLEAGVPALNAWIDGLTAAPVAAAARQSSRGGDAPEPPEQCRIALG